MTAPPTPPALIPMTQVRCEVRALVTLGAAPYGERRYIPLGGGTVEGPELNGTLVEGGVDWQINRADGVLDISAHYVIKATDGSLIEVTSDGMRHGPPEVIARLARARTCRARNTLPHPGALQTARPMAAHLTRSWHRMRPARSHGVISTTTASPDVSPRRRPGSTAASSRRPWKAELLAAWIRPSPG